LPLLQRTRSARVMPNDSFATIFHMAAAEGRSPSHGTGAAPRELDADDEAR